MGGVVAVVEEGGREGRIPLLDLNLPNLMMLMTDQNRVNERREPTPTVFYGRYKKGKEMLKYTTKSNPLYESDCLRLVYIHTYPKSE